MKRVLITGITGFIGQNLVNYLNHHEEHQLFGYSRQPEKAKKQFNNVEFLTELDAVRLDRYMINSIIHLAGIAHDLSGKFTEEDYMSVNYQLTANLYDEFLKSNVQQFVFVSSIKAVVDHTDEIITEDYKPEPFSPYGFSKLKAEEHLLKNRKSDKQIYVLRPCMVHGPGNKGNLNLLYKFVNSRMPFPLGAFENRRSYLSIENFCFVMLRILEQKIDQGTYLLADDEAISTTELVEMIGEVSKKASKIIHVPRGVMTAIARLGTALNAPFNKNTLHKLAGNMEISNEKLKKHLKEDLPVSTKEGLKRTLTSFHE